MATEGNQKIDPLRVLVVEDEYFVADEIAIGLKKIGAIVLGPVARLDQAMQIVSDDPPNAAILDVNLRGEMVFVLADQLAALGIPFLFATGYDAQTIPDRFQSVPRWEKPFDAKALATDLSAMTDQMR